jgi:NAD(P)-dependent dehydrogenase (short-subunit alcohol dehydrogenase family)
MNSRIAVVTGGLSGIGLACAQELILNGNIVAVGSRRCSSDAVNKVKEILGPDSFFYPLDVGCEKSVNMFCEKVTKELGNTSILVNSAGIYEPGLIVKPDSSHWYDQLKINLSGPFLMTKALMPSMIRNKFGRIVNVASTAGRISAAGYAGYCASKAGLISLSKTTAIEGAPHNVSCVSVSPTWVETGMLENAEIRHTVDQHITKDAARKALIASNPQGRLVQAKEIAALVAFACGDSCPALTNEDIQVNAGAIW